VTVAGVMLGHNFAAPRYLFPAMVPAALLFTRLLADRRDARVLLIVGAGIHGILGIGLTLAEHAHARAGVAVAEAALQSHSDPGWFSGEWSFRWRMEQAGWQLLAEGAVPTPGSTLVVGSESAPGPVPAGATGGTTWSSASRFPVRVVDAGRGIGLYGETLGLLPFGWGEGATQEAVSWTLP